MGIGIGLGLSMTNGIYLERENLSQPSIWAPNVKEMMKTDIALGIWTYAMGYTAGFLTNYYASNVPMKHQIELIGGSLPLISPTLLEPLNHLTNILLTNAGNIVQIGNSISTYAAKVF
jgi:hypothetical protein